MRKKIASIVLGAFLIAISGNYSYANNGVRVIGVNGYDISDYGMIVERYNGASDIKVICIKDLHCDKTTQENIAGIIDVLKVRFGEELRLIGQEGTFCGTEIDTSILGVIPYEDVDRDVFGIVTEVLEFCKKYNIKNKRVITNVVEFCNKYNIKNKRAMIEAA